MSRFLIPLLIVGCLSTGLDTASADSTLRISAEQCNEYNAQWQIYDDGGESVIACIRDGGSEHGDNDYTWFYNSTPQNLTFDLQPTLEFDYDVADTDDTTLSVYLCDREPTNSAILTSGEYLGNFIGDGSAEIALDETLTEAYIAFLWESGNSIGDGPIIDNVEVYLFDFGDFDEIWRQSTDQDTFGEAMHFNLSSFIAGEYILFSFWYTDDNHPQAWYWCIDDIVLTDDTRAVVYSEDFEDGDPEWLQIPISGDGLWQIYNTADNFRYGMTNNFFAADDDANPADYDVATLTPIIDCTDSSTVELDYMSNFQDFNGSGECALIVYIMDQWIYLEDDFDDMAAWSTVDEGDSSPITRTSWGLIKALD